jgi:predicted nucleotide-binding protein
MLNCARILDTDKSGSYAGQQKFHGCHQLGGPDIKCWRYGTGRLAGDLFYRGAAPHLGGVMVMSNLNRRQREIVRELVEAYQAGYDDEFLYAPTMGSEPSIEFMGREGVIRSSRSDLNVLQDAEFITLRSGSAGELYGTLRQRAYDAVAEARDFVTPSEERRSKVVNSPKAPAPETSPSDHRAVFVVHGRNLQARDAMFAFLRSLDLHPMEWSEILSQTGVGSPYIGDILDAAFGLAQAIVVLMTPDDEARLRGQYRQAREEIHEIELTPQARPNVLFEAGMAMGRSQNRTILVEMGVLRPFSDIGGRHVVRLNDSAPKRNEMAVRLAAAGCPVNRQGDDWLRAGDFGGALTEDKGVEQHEVVDSRTAAVKFRQSSRMVFYEPGFPCSWVSAPERGAAYFEAQGFMRIGSQQLAEAMEQAIDAKTADRSLVVLLHDTIPESIAQVRNLTCTLGRYLQAGGRVAWWGDIPLHWRGRSRGVKEQWRGGPEILFVDHYFPQYKDPKTGEAAGPVLWDRQDLDGMVRFTDAGKDIGLRAPGKSIRPAAVDQLTIVYSELVGDLGFGVIGQGLRWAVAWRRVFNDGYPHSGFMQYPAGPVDCADELQLSDFHRFSVTHLP